MEATARQLEAMVHQLEAMVHQLEAMVHQLEAPVLVLVRVQVEAVMVVAAVARGAGEAMLLVVRSGVVGAK